MSIIIEYRQKCREKFGHDTEVDIFEEWDKRIKRHPRIGTIDSIFLYIHLVQDYKDALKPKDEELMNAYDTYKAKLDEIQQNIISTKKIELKNVLVKWKNEKQVKISGFVTCKICKSERAKIQRAQTRSLDESMTQIVVCEQCGKSYPTEQALK